MMRRLAIAASISAALALGAPALAVQPDEKLNNPQLESSSTEFFIVHGSTYADYQVEQELENMGLTLTPAQKDVYVNEGGYMSLDQQYTTFGEVVEGLDVIEEIAAEKVYDEDKPLRKIPMKISVIKN